MLRAAGELADGTVTWMVGLNTLREHIVPPITSAAAAAGRPSPRICVGAPVAVADDAEAARAAVSREYGDRWQSPAYRRVLRQEGAIDTGDVSIVGNEAEVIDQLRAFAEAGTTDLLAAVVPIGADPGPTMTRTRALLSSVVGRL
jgi:alkanesulfonate monooxygenase SsuD/methylene tetrahydromethanopterin reductase-like flavin-dependent oxidoreductase (luciferase family)